MSQAWASLSKACILLSICFIVSACNGSYTAFEDDVDFDSDAKTVDIELDNAEEVALNVLQSAYTAHFRSALYNFLDASDLPYSSEAPVYDSGSKSYSLDTTCMVDGVASGSAVFTFSRPAGEAHKAGDRIALSFDNCVLEEGVFNGSLTGRYTKIEGLNNAFVGTDTETCLANLLDELAMNNDQVIYVSGDDLKFRTVANTLEVDVVDYVYTESEGNINRSDIVLDTYIIPENEKAILVNTLPEPPPNAVTSVNGDQLYSVDDLEQTKHACQGYARTLSVTLDEFSTTKDDLTTVLHGAVTLFEEQESAERVNQEIINSNFQTRVEQGNLKQNFRMSNYRVQKGLKLDNGTYSYLFEGLVNSAALNGTVELTSLAKLFGNLEEPYPSSGSLEIKGQGLERILVRVNLQNVELQIDFNGDSTGSGFGDFDARVDSRWADLYARDFQF